jgi:hypothetical protein
LVSVKAAATRLKFEGDQLSAELKEAVQLLDKINEERLSRQTERGNIELQLRRVEGALLSFQAAAAAIMPEEVGLIDQEIGARNEKSEALQRLTGPLQRRDEISAEIDRLQSEAKQLESILADKEEKVELETASDRLADGFNSYLNALRQLDSTAWTKSSQVVVHLTERTTRFLIGSHAAIPQLGGTLMIYFLFAYHYALLSLTRFPDCHYPGLTILDLFPDIIEGVAMRDRLSLVLEPFVELSERQDVSPIQVIASGNDFPSSPVVNRIALEEVWR